MADGNHTTLKERNFPIVEVVHGANYFNFAFVFHLFEYRTVFADFVEHQRNVGINLDTKKPDKNKFIRFFYQIFFEIQFAIEDFAS